MPEQIRSFVFSRLEAFFGADSKRIQHARDVLEFAEDLAKREGANARVAIAAAILHDVGIRIAEEKYGWPAPHLQELEGPPVAMKLLEGSGLSEREIDAVCAIVANHHTTGRIDSPEFRVVYDADWLVNLREIAGRLSKDQIGRAIEVTLLTASGRDRARHLYVGQIGGDTR
jgi:HD superfamily phosphodiesterase